MNECLIYSKHSLIELEVPKDVTKCITLNREKEKKNSVAVLYWFIHGPNSVCHAITEV